MSLNRAVRCGISGVVLTLLIGLASPAEAQVSISGGLDATHQYRFRGIRQNSSGASFWPWVDFGGTTYEGDGALKSVALNIGTWNAIHTELDGNKWYEGDVYGTATFGFSKASLATTFTHYTSPGDWWGNIEELAFKLSFSDGVGLNPYVFVAQELGEGSADGGDNKGTYLEFGVGPGISRDKVSVTFPIKVGLSANNYYEVDGSDNTFGYVSFGGVVTVPAGEHFNVHGGVEVQAYGDALKSDKSAEVIGSIGIGFSF